MPMARRHSRLAARASASATNGELATSSSQSMTSLCSCLLGVAQLSAKSPFSLRRAVIGDRTLTSAAPRGDNGEAITTRNAIETSCVTVDLKWFVFVYVNSDRHQHLAEAFPLCCCPETPKPASRAHVREGASAHPPLLSNIGSIQRAFSLCTYFVSGLKNTRGIQETLSPSSYTSASLYDKQLSANSPF